MAETLEQHTKEILRSYLREVKSLPNESAKRARFAALIGELFPKSEAINEYSQGVEKLIRIRRPAGAKRGHADTYYGNAIVEFEKSLSSTLAHAEDQLREYVSGTWQSDKNSQSMLAIASDGLRWRVYRPVLLPETEPSSETIRLDLLRDFTVNEETVSDFWLWLTGFLFRPQQMEPTADRFREDFGVWSPLFRTALAALILSWVEARNEPESKLAFETWQRYLTVTYGRLTEKTVRKTDQETAAQVSELELLFLRHTYLACVARLVIWAALSRGKSTDDLSKVAKDVLSGRYFQSRRLANLVDDDFFHWVRITTVEEALAGTWQRILSHLTDYDLSKVREDVLKGVYEQLIDPKDRHDLGEYYTPDWLCELMVQQLLPKTGYCAVLDPACGSGSFLRAIISHFLETNQSGTDHDRLRTILANVQGIDIHPVAVTIARATYILALGKLVNAARKPIQIPVYLADSLFLPREVERNLIEQLSGVEITFGPRPNRKRFLVPDMVVRRPELFDEVIAACAVVAEDHARTGRENRASMAKHLMQVTPELSSVLQYELALDALWEFVNDLAELIRDRRNSIWSFIIRNSYRPAMLKEQFDVIIGNPPWLSYRFISDPDYQEEVKRRAVDLYRIAPKSQKLFTQMELGTVFLAHSIATFSNANGRLGFVMPRAVLNADQHQNLIQRRYSLDAKLKLTGYWDLLNVRPLFKIPACVLFAKRDLGPSLPSEELPALEWEGQLPKRDVRLNIAKKHLESERKTARVIYLGERAALSTQAGASEAAEPSKYQAEFKQGATIVPRSFYFVDVSDLDAPVDPNRDYWAQTDREQAKQAKKPYDDVSLSGFVEGRFIYTTSIARYLVPFALIKTVPVVLPVYRKNGSLSLVTSERLMKDGYRNFGKWIERAETLWKTKRKDKAGRQNLYQRLDYQKELTRQNLDERYLVLYNHSGMNVSATTFDRHSQTIPFVVDVKLYWAPCRTLEEADYLAAILNSETVNAAIKPFQSMGLLGERDIHKKLLELPIPLFTPDKSEHSELAKLGACTRRKVEQVVHSAHFPATSSIARKRGFVRDSLMDELKNIDGIVRSLLST
jgi:type I restriction-modification system DNA methylase subunit